MSFGKWLFKIINTGPNVFLVMMSVTHCCTSKQHKKHFIICECVTCSFLYQFMFNLVLLVRCNRVKNAGTKEQVTNKTMCFRKV